MQVGSEQKRGAPAAEKPLSAMTLEELWQLFPVQLCPPDPVWQKWYQEEAQRLLAFLPKEGLTLHHIGSTAVPGIWAKPIVDILLEAPDAIPMAQLREVLLQNGYLCMAESPKRMSLNRGYTSQGFAARVFHLHARRPGDHPELYFRDYLREHPQVAKAYETLKRSLAEPFRYNRDGYTNAKGPFIAQWTAQAQAIYSQRYDSSLS